MGLFDMLMGKNINEGLETYRQTEGAVLVDVREADEYAGGHVPESINVPLSDMQKISYMVEDRATPLFLYCHSGARSSSAASGLKRAGYSNVNNIGGIASYKGELERWCRIV